MTISRKDLAIGLAITVSVCVATLSLARLTAPSKYRVDEAAVHAQATDPINDRAPGSLPVVTPVPDKPALPPSSAELSKFLDRDASVNQRTENLDLRIPLLVKPSDITWVRYVLRDPGEHDTVRHEAIMLLTRSHYAELVNDLAEILRDPRERSRFRAFCAQAVGVAMKESDTEDLRETSRKILKYLVRDRDVEVRRESLYGLVTAGDVETRELVSRADLSSESYAGMRDLLIRCWSDMGCKDRITDIRQSAYSLDITMKISALNVLGEWHDDQSLPAMQEACHSPIFAIKQAGLLAQRRLQTTPTASESDHAAP